ncbi:MAG: Stp1/IreP family PP2C-type Ser/Thr phosphatase [Lachnospiraceae bacterium]|nr:Stp1/IreP family PP2C-type Ser/Thr phosphatase [Lachnospiraceae bacterium]MDD3617125.1 Stp1/IreP family PP2C-type Ser/Thr phosphatase [Lachnospiraceae bacterium]
MKSYSVTDVGQRRKINQDYVFASEEPVGNLPNLFVVADGMGGHNAGDFASSYAVSVLVDTIRQDTEFNPIKLIRTAIEEANRRLIEKAAEEIELIGMGTTMVAVTIVGHYAYIANVGDSRLYVLDQNLCQITKDHSLVEEMVRMGELSEEEARVHPDKNIITRALGAGNSIDIDFFDYRLNNNSLILMCSDGLTNMVADEQIEAELLGDRTLEEKAQTLIGQANENGGKDNIAVIVIQPFTDEVEEC